MTTTNWKTIESAPTFETILVWGPQMNRPQFASVWTDGTVFDDEGEWPPTITGATHWMPFPSPPAP